MRQTGMITAADGAPIGWEAVGQGPGLVLVHGGGQRASHYRPLAERLARQFTVFAIDRRGRGATGPASISGPIDVDVSDLSAVLRATGARMAFGHSAGGVVVLEAARRGWLDRAAVYEPPVAMPQLVAEGLLELEWLETFRRALERDRLASAFVAVAAGLQLESPWVPAFALRAFAALAMRTAQGRAFGELLRTVPRDLELALALAGDVAAFADVPCPVLLACGERTQAYLRRASDLLRDVLPRGELILLPKADHLLPVESDCSALAAPVQTFFARSTPSAADGA